MKPPTGCEDRKIRVWSVAEKVEVDAWAVHAGVPRSLKWAPRRMLVASACNALSLWVPSMAVLQQLQQQPGQPPPAMAAPQRPIAV